MPVVKGKWIDLNKWAWKTLLSLGAFSSLALQAVATHWPALHLLLMNLTTCLETEGGRGHSCTSYAPLLPWDLLWRFIGQQWGRQWLSFSWVWVYLSSCIWVWLAILNPWTISQDGISTCIVSCRHCPGLGSAPFLVRVWPLSEAVYVLCLLVNWFLPSCKNTPVH